MNSVFEAEGCLPALTPNTKYIVFGWRVMIVYSEKYISPCGSVLVERSERR